MSSTLSNRATFYDLFCYWVSGFAFLGVGLLYLYAFCPGKAQVLFSWMEASKWSYFVVVILGYIAGHLANALSSLLVEHTFARKHLSRMKHPFAGVIDAMNPETEIPSSIRDKAKAMYETFEHIFGYRPCEDSRRELRLIAQARFGGEPPAGMNYMAYYGLNRVLFMTSVFALLPIVVILVESGSSWPCVVVAVILNIMISLAFLWQYLRFVIKYSEFLASFVLVEKLKNNAK